MPREPARNDAERVERAEEYLAAAREHFVALQQVGEHPNHYPMAYYIAGLALECLFRAYGELVGAEHDAKHDLRKQADNSAFLHFMPESVRAELQQHLTDVWLRWLNNHRYRSRASLKRFLNDAELYKLSRGRTVQGDVVHYNWGVLFEASATLLTWGIEQWNNSKRKWNR